VAGQDFGLDYNGRLRARQHDHEGFGDSRQRAPAEPAGAEWSTADRAPRGARLLPGVVGVSARTVTKLLGTSLGNAIEPGCGAQQQLAVGHGRWAT
jgi:hypothetical protein